jgi:DNA invertase Pin-like site-specific DNA recombinase
MAEKTTAIYVRVSSIQQKVDSQEDELKRWIDVHQPKKVKWYRDTFTGKSMDRPSMGKLIDDLNNNKIETILIWRLDRLGRTASGLTKLFDELQRYKCNLISLKDHLDLSTPSGRLNANIIASVANYETEVRAERVKAGQASAMARGKKWGGSKKGDRKGKVASKEKTILALLEQGVSKAEISRSVGISIPTIYSIIKGHK